MRIGVVTGLAREARIAAAAGLAVACHGPGPGAGRSAAERLARQGADLLVSFGYAGGLDRALAAGALVVPADVMDMAGRRWACAALPGVAAGGTLLAADRPVGAPAQKRSLAGRAAAVDCESHAVAAVAAEWRIGFTVVRAVVDPAGLELPPAALAAVDAKGRFRPARLLAALKLRDLSVLWRLAAATRQADRQLAAMAALLARLG